MGHPRDPDELLEIFGNELGAIVGNNPGLGFRVFLLGPLEDDFHVCLCHLLSDLPMDDRAAAAIQEAAQVVECAMDVEIRDVYMPMFMGTQRLNKSSSF